MCSRHDGAGCSNQGWVIGNCPAREPRHRDGVSQGGAVSRPGRKPPLARPAVRLLAVNAALFCNGSGDEDVAGAEKFGVP